MSSIFDELKRRNVFRIAGMDAVVGWLLMRIFTQLETSLNLPAWFDTVVTVIVLLGLPVVLILARHCEVPASLLMRQLINQIG